MHRQSFWVNSMGIQKKQNNHRADFLTKPSTEIINKTFFKAFMSQSVHVVSCSPYRMKLLQVFETFRYPENGGLQISA